MDVCVRFTIDAEASVGLLPRLLQPFAKRGLVPDWFLARREGETMRVEMRVEGMDADAVRVAEGSLRAVVGVWGVVVGEG